MRGQKQDLDESRLPQLNTSRAKSQGKFRRPKIDQFDEMGATIAKDDEIVSAKRKKANDVLDRLLIDANIRQARKIEIEMLKEEQKDRPIPGPRESFNRG